VARWQLMAEKSDGTISLVKHRANPEAGHITLYNEGCREILKGEYWRCCQCLLES
jgi:hypothetical protein